MSELKTCWTCKHREKMVEYPPCSDCDDEQHDFTTYTNWEPRENE